MTEPDRFACTLDERDLPARTTQVASLARHTRRSEQDAGRAVVEFSPAAEPLVHEFVRDESQCCGFFGFRVEPADEHVRLEVTAPRGAGHLLDALVEALDPAADGAGGRRLPGGGR